MAEITRRDFIKGAATGAVVAAGAGMLASCGETETVDPNIPETWDHEADVVVVGYGGAGAAAAIEAADNGAKVLILEKQPENAHYSNTRMSGGLFHTIESGGDLNALKQYLKGMFSGENLPGKLEGEQPDESDALAEEVAKYHAQNATFMESLDPDFEYFVYRGAAYTWFPGAEDSKYQVVIAQYPDSGEADPDTPPYDLPKLQKRSGEAFFACLSKGVDDRDVDIMYSTPAKRLVKKDGEIIGVIAEKAGSEVACKAKKAVILTSGGYEYHTGMRRGFLEGPGVRGWAFYGTPDNTGDGIDMAVLAGGGLAKVGKAASRVITAVPYGRGYQETGLKMGLITPVVGRPNAILVDNYGKRYAAENNVTDDPWRYSFYKVAVHYDMLTLDYPRVPSWLVFDETMRTTQTVTYMNLSTAGFGFIPWTTDNMDAIDRGWILKGDTVADVASKIKTHADNVNKMDIDALVDTVERYNAFCAAGEDTDFQRKPASLGPVETPPFYAFPVYPGGPNTKGGIMADGTRHVLNWEGNQIPRLYTAGEISSAFKFVYQGGGNLTECLACGRIAGKNAAAESNWS